MIEIKGLTKRFDKVVAVNSLNLSVREGTVMGLVGSNGSGKSTLLRMLAGVFRGEEGSILLDGRELFDNPEAKRIPRRSTASFIRTGAMRRTCATARFSR